MRSRRLAALWLAFLLLASLTACGLALQPVYTTNGTAAQEQQEELVLLPDEPEKEDEPSAPPEDAPENTQTGETLPDTPENTEANDVPDTPDVPEETAQEDDPPEDALSVTEDGEYDSRDEVALYIHLYGHLPSNYISKTKAQALGWNGGSLEPYAPGKSIGGGYFGNYEGLLPAKKGRSYTECDIDTRGKSSRGAKRIVFSNDGLIYYSDDHYQSFTLLYGEE